MNNQSQTGQLGEKIPAWKIIDEEEVLKLTKDLIEMHHRPRCILNITDVGLIWKMKGWSDNKAGTCKLVGPAMQIFFAKPVKFIITLDRPKWDELSSEQQMALLDHELCHCDFSENEKTGEIKARIREHNIEEFNEIVMRHGAWDAALQVFVDCIDKNKKVL